MPYVTNKDTSIKKFPQVLSRHRSMTNERRSEKKGSDCAGSSDKQTGRVVSIHLDGKTRSEKDQEIRK